MKILSAGGREGAGGVGQIDFGVGTARNVLSAKARAEKDGMVKYEKLPADIREKMTKKEYLATAIRGSDDEEENDGGGLLPVVVFCFSKKRCEEIADFLKGQDMLTQREKGKVGKLMGDVIMRLNPVDADLPQILRLKDMLSRGIGVHHGGLLPILKEAVEMLFSESIVKVLIATETFAMGVNMPARAVVFNGFRKHDGKSFRDLLPGEYTQMAGRAGRRGLDRVGTVIVAAWTDPPEEFQLKKLLTGTATKLSSQFRLRYNMILNLVRVNNLSVEEMMKRSFTEFHNQKNLATHDLKTKLTQYELLLNFLEGERIEDVGNEFFADIYNYLDCYTKGQGILLDQLKYLTENMKKFDYNKSIFNTGRVVAVHTEELGCPCLAVILSTFTDRDDMKESFAQKAGQNSMVAARNSILQRDTNQVEGNANAAKHASELKYWVLVSTKFTPELGVAESTEFPSIDFNNLKYEVAVRDGQVYKIISVKKENIGLIFRNQLSIDSSTPIYPWVVYEELEIMRTNESNVADTDGDNRTGKAMKKQKQKQDLGSSDVLTCIDLVAETKNNEMAFVEKQMMLSQYSKEVIRCKKYFK